LGGAKNANLIGGRCRGTGEKKKVRVAHEPAKKGRALLGTYLI